MTAKHTPGPWQTPLTPKANIRGAARNEFFSDENGDVYCTQLSNGSAIIGQLVQYGAFQKEIAEANAHLIAAAPELLEALDQLLSEVHGVSYGDIKNVRVETIRAAKAAIAKAEGSMPLS